MKHVGYGVTVDGKPTGIWPTSWTHAQQVRDRKRFAVVGPAERAKIQIVEVFASGPVADPPKLQPLTLNPEALA